VRDGFVYIAQPPLYSMTRKKRTEYVDDDAQLNKILLQIGTEEVRLKNLSDEKEIPPKQLEEILALLESLDKYPKVIRRHGGDFGDYVERRTKKGMFPAVLIKVRDGNEETVHYFEDLDEVAKFKDKNPDLYGDEKEKEKAEK